VADITTLRPKAIIFDQVEALLTSTTAVPSYFGEGGTHKVKKRYNWEPGPLVPSGPTEIGDEPRRLHDLACSFTVACRAAEYDDACEMAADLVTAVRQVMAGASYAIGPFEIASASGESSVMGWTIYVPLTVTLSLPESPLDAGPWTTAEVETVAFDTSSADPDDGELIAGEP
jgi:hypothetical protein